MLPGGTWHVNHDRGKTVDVPSTTHRLRRRRAMVPRHRREVDDEARVGSAVGYTGEDLREAFVRRAAAAPCQLPGRRACRSPVPRSGPPICSANRWSLPVTAQPPGPTGSTAAGKHRPSGRRRCVTPSRGTTDSVERLSDWLTRRLCAGSRAQSGEPAVPARAAHCTLGCLGYLMESGLIAPTSIRLQLSQALDIAHLGLTS